MTAQELKKIIDKWNKDSLKSLEEHLRIKAKEFDDSGARVYESIEDRSCYCGGATGLCRFPDQLKHSVSGESLAVGAVLDNATLSQNQDLPVVVAIGINYTQFDSSKSKVVLPQSWADTQMWRRLGLVLHRLDSDCFRGEIEERFREIWPDLDKKQPKPFHLVAVNYFPWVTRSEWGAIGLNAIAESIIIYCWGYANPAERVAQLIELIAKARSGAEKYVGEIPFVVFHGANNAVPYFAFETIRLLSGKFFSNYIFSDNLSRPSQPANAIVLLPRIPVFVNKGILQDTLPEQRE
jgi:hypothetical protein